MRLIGLAIIWLVTAYDIWCCQWLTLDGEQNPLAALLLADSVWTLVSAKVVGTFIATELLRRLHWGYLATITALELTLAAYLTFGEPL